MQTNILKAVLNIGKSRISNVNYIRKYKISINSEGDGLDYYIRDAFCGTFNSTEIDKEKSYQANFSYLGNQNNPPDFIIKFGDAVEVKKTAGRLAGIALNSSYPRSKIYSDDAFFTRDCLSCETPKWTEKDVIYAMGTVSESKLKVLWFVYGDCYAADRQIYERIKLAVKDGVESIHGIEFSETEELGKVKKVDPLGITTLRIRGVWHMDGPFRLFAPIVNYSASNACSVFCILKTTKYNSFPEVDRLVIESGQIKGLMISDHKIKNPNNPAQTIDAKLIKLVF